MCPWVQHERSKSLLEQRHPAGFPEFIANPETVHVSAAGHCPAAGVRAIPGGRIDSRFHNLIHQDFHPLADKVVDHQLSRKCGAGGGDGEADRRGRVE